MLDQKPTAPAGKVGRFTIPAKPAPASALPPPIATKEPTPGEIAEFANGAASRSTAPPPSTFFNLSTEEGRNELVIVKGKIKRGDVSKSSYLMIPGPTDKRLERVLMGALTPGIIGLVEFALDELERQGKTLVVDNHKL